MKNILRLSAKIVLAIVSCASFVCMTGETVDPSGQALLSIGSAAVFVVSANLLVRLCGDDVKNEEV